MAEDGSYTDDEVRAIIDRALKSELLRDVSHEQLVAIASEVGITREGIEAAAHEIRHERESNEAKQRIVARRRRALSSHVWTFLIVNAFLFAINFLSTPGEWWFLFPFLGWGLGLLFHLRAGLSGHVSERACAREKKRMRAERRLLEPSRKRVEPSQPAKTAGALDGAAAEFGSAVQEKVGLLLSRAAEELRRSTREPRVRVEGSPSSHGSEPLSRDEDIAEAEPAERHRGEGRG